MAEQRRDAISVGEAQRCILADVVETAVEQVPVGDCVGRVLGEALVAKLTQPPFDASAMDGFAVRTSDVGSLPVRLKVVGQSAAGHGFNGVVGPGEAVRIFTGAPVPEGADGIVIQENANIYNGAVEVVHGQPDRDHIRPSGGDFSIGDVVVQRGEILSARHATLCAGMGYGVLAVRRAPVVAILSTGDELVAPGTTPGPSQIVASNDVGIAGIVNAAGGNARRLGIARDTRVSLEKEINAARDADILVTIGGASVGDHDLVGPVLEGLGMVRDFWNISMRPGKPLLFGRLDAQRVIGVPGNPVSSLICARVFVVPLVRAMLGVQPPVDFGLSRAQLLNAIPRNGPRAHYMRGRLTSGDDGTRRVEALDNQDSSLMVAMVRANCLIIRSPKAPAAEIGENVTVMPLDF